MSDETSKLEKECQKQTLSIIEYSDNITAMFKQMLRARDEEALYKRYITHAKYISDELSNSSIAAKREFAGKHSPADKPAEKQADDAIEYWFKIGASQEVQENPLLKSLFGNEEVNEHFNRILVQDIHGKPREKGFWAAIKRFFKGSKTIEDLKQAENDIRDIRLYLGSSVMRKLSEAANEADNLEMQIEDKMRNQDFEKDTLYDQRDENRVKHIRILETEKSELEDKLTAAEAVSTDFKKEVAQYILSLERECASDWKRTEKRPACLNDIGAKIEYNPVKTKTFGEHIKEYVFDARSYAAMAGFGLATIAAGMLFLGTPSCGNKEETKKPSTESKYQPYTIEVRSASNQAYLPADQAQNIEGNKIYAITPAITKPGETAQRIQIDEDAIIGFNGVMIKQKDYDLGNGTLPVTINGKTELKGVEVTPAQVYNMAKAIEQYDGKPGISKEDITKAEDRVRTGYNGLVSK